MPHGGAWLENACKIVQIRASLHREKYYGIVKKIKTDFIYIKREDVIRMSVSV